MEYTHLWLRKKSELHASLYMNSREDDFLAAYHEYNDALFRYSYFKVSDREKAIDLVQECFTKTWSYLAGGGTINSFKPFLYRTLTNLIIDSYRQKKHASLDVLAEEGFDPGEDPSDDLINSLDGEKIIALLQKLPDEYRDVLFLRYVNEFSFTEIAKLTGETANALTVRAHRGLEKLKALILTHHE